jgi:hypothetical protein
LGHFLYILCHFSYGAVWAQDVFDAFRLDLYPNANAVYVATKDKSIS